MNIPKLTNLADSGDIDAIYSLGESYLNNENEIDNAIKCFIAGAEKNSTKCMHMLASAIVAKSVMLRKCTDSPNYFYNISMLDNALYWETKATESGDESKDIHNKVCSEIGISYYFLSIDPKTDVDHATLYLEISISYLKPLYGILFSTESGFYLGCALHDYSLLGKGSPKDTELSFRILKNCVDEYSGELPSIANISYCVGMMYTEGRGCHKNYDKALHYFKLAHNSGYDCSEILNRFKKNLFGGYNFI